MTVEPNYQPGSNWVASILVGELRLAMGSSPRAGLADRRQVHPQAFYGNNPVTSNVKVNKAVTIDGHEGWVVESQLSFDITGLKTR